MLVIKINEQLHRLITNIEKVKRKCYRRRSGKIFINKEEEKQENRNICDPKLIIPDSPFHSVNSWTDNKKMSKREH